MNPEYQTILEDLYAVDPSLREHEGVLIKLVQELLKARPEAVINEAFRAELKAKLIERARELTLALGPRASWFGGWFEKLQFNPAWAGIAAVLVVAALTAVYRSGMPGRQSTPVQTVAFQTNITKLGSQAFGDLKLQPNQDRAWDLGGGVAVAPQLGIKGSEGVTKQAGNDPTNAPFENSTTSSPGSGSASADFGGGAPQVGSPPATPKPTSGVSPTTRIYPGPDMPGYQSAQYRFVYRGNEIKGLSKEVEVLRRTSGGLVLPNASGLNQALLNFGLNLSGFSELGVTQVTLNQDTSQGYSLYVDFENGQMNLNQNMRYEKQPWLECRDEACSEGYRLRESDVLSDKELVAIAKQFLAKHGVGLGVYGEPVVQNEWQAAYDKLSARDRATYYIPDVMTVLFPLRIQGQGVYEGFQPVGLGVGVSLRDKSVTGVWNLTTQNYESSTYPAISEATQVIAAAEQGGYGSGYGVSAPKPFMLPLAPGQPPVQERSAVRSEPTAEVELGTPERAYLKVWTYRAEMSQGEELYVPAFVFPVARVPQGVEIYQKYVVVPLVHEFWSAGGPVMILKGGMDSSGSGGMNFGSTVSPATEPVPPEVRP